MCTMVAVDEVTTATLPLAMTMDTAGGSLKNGPADTSRAHPAEVPVAPIRTLAADSVPGRALTGLPQTRAMHDGGRIGRGRGPTTHGEARSERRGTLVKLPHGQPLGIGRPFKLHKPPRGSGRGNMAGSSPVIYPTRNGRGSQSHPQGSDLDMKIPGTHGTLPQGQAGGHPQMRVGPPHHGGGRPLRGNGHGPRALQPTSVAAVCHHSPSLGALTLEKALLPASSCGSYRGPPWAGRRLGSAGG